MSSFLSFPAQLDPPPRQSSPRNHTSLAKKNRMQSPLKVKRRPTARIVVRPLGGQQAEVSQIQGLPLPSERSASYDGRERVFAYGVPVRSTAPISARRRKARSKSVPPAQDHGQSQRRGAREEMRGNQEGHGVDYRGGSDMGNDDGVRSGEARAASVPV
jgi:hypothetical protein